MKALFGTSTVLFLLTTAIALSIDPLWGLLTAAGALSSGIGYLHMPQPSQGEQAGALSQRLAGTRATESRGAPADHPTHRALLSGRL
jgi:hypothetical protein